MVPSDWTKQITIPIFKKGSRLKCDNFRGISLLCSAYKVFARAMLNRMKHYVEEQLSESQCGFRAKRGCCDQLFSTKILMQRAKEFNVPVFLCFIDLCKAYDSVNRNLLWAVLRRVYNFPEKFVSIIEALHKETYGVVRFEGQLSKEYKVESGVKQGDVLAPTLFNLFLDVIIRTAMIKHPDTGVHIQYNLDALLVNNSRHKFNMSDKVQILMYAADVVLLSNDRSVLNSLIQSLSEEFTRYGLKINTQKSKIMAVRPEADNTNTHLDNSSVHQIDGGSEEVELYQYLGSILRNDCSIDEEIDTRICKASIAFRSIGRLIWYQKKLKKNEDEAFQIPYNAYPALRL